MIGTSFKSNLLGDPPLTCPNTHHLKERSNSVSVSDCICHTFLSRASKSVCLLYIPHKGAPPAQKNVFFRALPKPPLPQSGKLYNLFLDVKNDVLTRITEPSNDDYDNDGSGITIKL